MKKTIAILLLSSASVFAGELPELFEKPWTAWYSGFEGKRFHFGVDPDGNASLIPVDEKSKGRMSQHSWISVKPMIIETTSGGRDVVKKPLEDGWEALTPESNEAEKVSFRGTVTGGAKFEANFEVDGDELYCSGYLIDKGELTDNPIRFAIEVTVPNSYRHTRDEEDLEEKTKGDRFDFLMANKKKEKFKGDEPEDAVAKECEAIRWVRADISYYKGAKMEFDAGDMGLFEIEEPQSAPIAQGFTLVWTPDSAKNANGKAKMRVEYK
jgi:hypothetical protein